MKNKSWTEFQDYIAKEHPAIDDVIKKRQNEQGVNPIGIKGIRTIYACKLKGGFSWIITNEGHEFWSIFFTKQNTDVFYKKYPILLNKQPIFDF